MAKVFTVISFPFSCLALLLGPNIPMDVLFCPFPYNHGNQHCNETQRQFISTSNWYILTLGFPRDHSKIFHVPFTVAFVSQTESIWALQNTKVLLVKFETEILLIFEFTLKFQNIRQPPMDTFGDIPLVFANTLNFGSKADSTDRERSAWRSRDELYTSILASSHITVTMIHVEVTLLVVFASPYAGVPCCQWKELNITRKSTKHTWEF